ncbi:uncharacterized protein LOC118193185, partial [Stegodyphus dumicola]|uniref:uncharacterized protein LOC118193185 n=1 Tax=Stegodyphus dumicola TaxID=202533 RepID=UPI0015AEF489
MFKLFLIGWRREVYAMFSIYLIYLLAGAALFVLLEKGNEILVRKHIIEDLESAKNMIDGLREKNISDAEIFESFHQEHVVRKRENIEQDITWKQFYGEQVFFSLILITTV